MKMVKIVFGRSKLAINCGKLAIISMSNTIIDRCVFTDIMLYSCIIVTCSGVVTRERVDVRDSPFKKPFF